MAVLDWELSTLGHPLGDLAYNCLGYHYQQAGTDCSLSDIAGEESGIPTEEEYLAWYCERTGRDSIENWNFYLSFAVFRLASILQGVLQRGLQGNASSDTAIERGSMARQAAEMALGTLSRTRYSVCPEMVFVFNLFPPPASPLTSCGPFSRGLGSFRLNPAVTVH